MKKLIFMLTSLLLVCGVFAVDYHKFTLKNGLKTIVYEDHRIPQVAMYIYYNVGSNDEDKGESGIAHVVEHMMFNGTASLDKTQIDELIRGSGGYSNAYTSDDHTCYYIIVPSYNIEMAMRIESDRMANASMAAEVFDNEMKVIKQEKLMRYGNNAWGRFWMQFDEFFYDKYCYQHPTIGYDGDLDNMTIEKTRKFYNRFYKPNNAILVLAGDIKKEDAEKLTREYFGEIKPSTLGKRIPKPKLRLKRGKTLKTIPDPMVATYNVFYSFDAPGYGHKDFEKLYLAAQILSSGAQARLRQRLVDTGIAHAAWASCRVGRHMKPFNVGGSFATPEAMEQGRTILLDEVEKLKKGEISEKDIQRIINFIETEEIFKVQKAADIGKELGMLETYYKVEYINEFLNKIKKVTPSQIAAAVKKYLTEKNMSVTEFIPSEKEESALTPPEEEEDPHYSTDIPEIVTVEKDVLKKSFSIFEKNKKYILSNGLKVIAYNDNTVPGIFLRISMKAGPSFVPDRNGIPQMMIYCINEGTAKYDLAKLNEITDFYAIGYDTNSGYETLTLRGEFLSKFKEQGLDVIAEMIRNPTFPAEGVEKVKRQVMTSIKYKQMNPDDMSEYYFDKFLYGEKHPYAIFEPGNFENVANVTPEMLREYHEKYIIPENITIAILGDMPEDDLKGLIEKYFGDWEKKGIKNEICSFPAFTVKKDEKKVPMPNIEQAVVQMGFKGIDYKSEDGAYLTMITSMLGGGSLTSILGQKIRLEKGLAYYVGCYQHPRSSGGYIKVVSGVSPDKADEFRDEIVKTFKEVGEAGFTEDNIEKTRNYIIGNLITGFEDNASIVGFLDNLDYQGLEVADYLNKLDKYYDADNEKLKEIFRKYFLADHIFLKVVPAEAK